MTVDEALALYVRPEKGAFGGHDWVESDDATVVLAAEVRRLRERLMTGG